MSIESEVVALTTATTALANAVNVQKVALDTAVTTSTAQADIASTKADEASVSASSTAADRVQTGLDRTATQTSASAAAISQASATTSASSASASVATAVANADIATTKATEASASATSAIAAINATTWVSGTTYALNAAVISPTDHLVYRCIVAGAGTVDPVSDLTNWLKVSQPKAGSGTTDAVTHDKLGSAAYADILQIALMARATGMGASLVNVTAATYAVTSTDTSLIVNYAGTVTLTLPDPVISKGRVLTLKTITANTVVSASANVSPVAGGAAATAILAATAGKLATLQSDGAVWHVMAQG